MPRKLLLEEKTAKSSGSNPTLDGSYIYASDDEKVKKLGLN